MDRDAKRRVDPGAVVFEIGARHRAADALKVGGQLASDIAAVEVVEPDMAEMIERGGEGRLLERGAHLRDLAVEQEVFAEADRFLHLRQLFGGEPRLAARDLVALARVLDRRRQQHIERQLAANSLAALRLGCFLRQHPAGNGARHGKRGKRPTRRDLVAAGLAVERDGGFAAGAPRPHQRAHTARRLADEPETVAADMVGVRIDRGDRGGHRQHGLDGVAAFGEDGAAVLDGGGMRRADDATAVAGGVEIHAAPASPRFFKSASGVGSRPRKAL